MRSKALQKAGVDGLCYLAGSVLYALSVNVFSAPNQIAPGGLTGLSTVLNYLFHLPIGVMVLVMNLPLLVAAWFRLGREFTLRTVVATVLSSVLMDVTAPFVPAFHGDKILTCLCGGVLAGAGLGLIFLRGATTGGSEVAARLLERRFSGVPVGQLILLVDGVVIAIAALVYRDLGSALYAALMIYVTTEVLDALVYGRRRGKMMLIMSGEPDRIAKEILTQMGRGVTILKATGAYTGDDRRVLLCAVSRSEVYALRTLVTAIDPAAFVILTSADEVHGQGFTKE